MMYCLNIFSCLALIFAILTIPAAISAEGGNAVPGASDGTSADKTGKAAGGHKHLKKRQAAESAGIGGTSVQMRLSGSLCIGCLVELERKLKLMPGIAKVKVDIPGTGGLYDGYGGPGAMGIITATMSYDPKTISIEQVEDFIRTQGYTLRKVIER